MVNKITSNKSYKQLAEYYDELTNLRVFTVYKSIIGKTKGSRMLDLGCGTGNLLKYYSSKNETYGIDGSPEMIKIAEAKDKNTYYSVGDIRNFKNNKKFDLITCTFDVINHLPTLKDWERLFKMAAACLSAGGIFIFDFNTIEGFKNYGGRTIFKKIGRDYILMRVKAEGQICFWIIDGFIKKSSGLFKHKKFIIEERSYPNKLIIKKVKKYFSIIKIINLDNNRIYIKAKKRVA
ncbi:MAG: class I SAM-dependent methyltransferase [Patescibacteria group bacterium]|jgi:predicted TPR repeat methyltransferase